MGNATIIEKHILIDCGIPFKTLSPYYNDIKLILLTHEHSDHFNPSTIRRFAIERPTVRFACGAWLAERLINNGVNKHNIDIMKFATVFSYGDFKVIPVRLIHNVPNLGYKIQFCDGCKMIYATDTNSLQGIKAPNYDLYLLEADYEDEEIQERIKAKQERGEYIYEYDVLKNHLSKAKCDEFLLNNIGKNSVFEYMHQHVERG